MNAQNWTVHRDPAGFTVETPRGWQVTAEGGRVTVAGPNRERVTILPVEVECRLDTGRAQGALVNLSRQFWPNQRWDMPRDGWQFGANGVRAVGADETELRETTALWWANTQQGATAFFYGVAAEPARFGSLAPTFARILGSFRVTPPDPLAGLQFQRWTDPAEGAYSAEVPAGWHVTGGVTRPGMVSTRSETVVESPDGQVTVRDGDVRVPQHFMEPNDILASNGCYEGQWASGGGYFILRFRPAVAFATEYVQQNVGQTCGNVEWSRQTERPDYIQQMAAQGLLLPGNYYTAGEVAFTCESLGQTHVGYLFAVTMMHPAPGVANMWSVERLTGFVAPADRATQADAVLHRLLATTRIDLQWWIAQGNANKKIYDELQRYREYASKLQQETQAERWASWARVTEARGDAIIGQTRVVDPQTGQPFKVQSGSSYYWIDPTHNVIAGTNMPYAPTWDFHEMIQTYR